MDGINEKRIFYLDWNLENALKNSLQGEELVREPQFVLSTKQKET